MTWPTERLSRLADVWPSNVDKHSIEGQQSVRLCNYTDVYKNPAINGAMAFMPATATSEQIERFRLVVGDTLITKDSETADDIGIPAFVEYEAPDLICGYHLAIVRPAPSVAAPRFVYWALSSEFVRRQWSVLASGVTRVALRRADLSRVQVPYPPLELQRAIADYLDRETAQVDTLIAKQEQLIARLRERTSSLRSSLLAGHGDRRRIPVRRALEKLHRVPEAGYGVVTAYRDGVVTLRSNRREGGYTFSDSEAGYQGIEPGDIVFHALDGFAGAVGVSDSRGVGSPVYHVCRPCDGVDAKYVAELLRFLGTSGFLAQQAPNVRERSIDFRNWQTFARVPLELPRIEQQRLAVERLVEHDKLSGALTAKAERFIELAKERRAALITAAVTGQIDVRAG